MSTSVCKCPQFNVSFFLCGKKTFRACLARETQQWSAYYIVAFLRREVKKVSEPPAPQRSTAGRPSATKNSEPGRAHHGGELPGPSARAGNAYYNLLKGEGTDFWLMFSQVCCNCCDERSTKFLNSDRPVFRTD